MYWFRSMFDLYPSLISIFAALHRRPGLISAKDLCEFQPVLGAAIAPVVTSTATVRDRDHICYTRCCNEPPSPGSTVVIADWTATGTGEAGPPLDERYSGLDAEKLISNYGLEIKSLVERPETFLLTAQMV